MIDPQPPFAVVALALWLGACASSKASAPAEPGAGESGPALGAAAAAADPLNAEADLAVRGDLAPRPFTAEQIAAGMPVGHWHRYRIEQQGEASIEQLTTVLSHQDAGVTLQTQVFALDGTPRGEPGSMTADWVELRNHASFPVADTVLRETQLALPSGTFDCWRYTVTSKEEGQRVVSRYYFAKSRPGAPVRYDLVRDGVREFRMTLVSSGGPPE